MKCCHFQNGESEGSKPLNVVQRSFPNNRKKQEQKQKQKLHSLKRRHSLHMCSAKGGKVTGVWDPPCAQVFNITSDETRREEGSEAWAAGKIPGEGDGTEPGLKRKESLIHGVMGLSSRKGLSLGANAEGRQAGRQARFVPRRRMEHASLPPGRRQRGGDLGFRCQGQPFQLYPTQIRPNSVLS